MKLCMWRRDDELRKIKQDYSERMCRRSVGRVKMAFYFNKSQLTRKSSKSPEHTVCISRYNFVAEVLACIPRLHNYCGIQ